MAAAASLSLAASAAMSDEEEDFDIDERAMAHDHGAAPTPATQPPRVGGAAYDAVGASEAAATGGQPAREWLNTHHSHRTDLTRGKEFGLWVTEIAQVLEGAQLYTQTQVRRRRRRPDCL